MAVCCSVRTIPSASLFIATLAFPSHASMTTTHCSRPNTAHTLHVVFDVLPCLGQHNNTSLDCGISSTVSSGSNCLCGVSAPAASMFTHGTSTYLKPRSSTDTYHCTTDTFPRVTTADRVSRLATGLPNRHAEKTAHQSGLPRTRLSRQKGTHTGRQTPILHTHNDVQTACRL
jgi:hypothetical protein